MGGGGGGLDKRTSWSDLVGVRQKYLLVSLKILFHDSKDVEGEDDGRSTGHNYFIKTLITDTENGPLCRIQMILRPEV